MSNATSTASSSSASSSQSAQVPSPVPTVSGEGRYGENITYPNGLKPNPYQLLHLFNSEQYDDQIRAATDQHNRLEPCIKSLFFLRTQCKLFKRIIESCSLEIVNQVMYACNYKLGLAGPITVPSTFPYHPHLSMPPPADPQELTNGNGYPRPDINDTQSLISRLTSEPIPSSSQLPAATHSSPEPDTGLIYPDPTPDPDIKPKIKSIDSTSSLQSRAPTTKVEHIPAVGGEVAPEEYEGEDEDDEQENQIPENNNAQPTLRSRNPTPAPTPMTQLVDCVSALCADWNAISPDIARTTALTNKGLTALCIEGLIRAQTLCQMIAIMMMSLTTISEENVETLEQEYDRDAQLLFVGADPQKAQLLLVEEWLAMGWQPPLDFPPTPRLGMVDDMLDTSYDYNMELYGDGES
uniref:Reverse transcriptase-rnase h-integrase n=1 Tax=Moniliophthora roreri TaxID=221103 RepID=A0A0W0FED6_MONRR